MITVRKSEERGKANFGWLDANYSFSFGDYFDPNHTGFRDLVVINQDTIEANSGFGMHPHKNMEIITYIIEGSIEHEDSEGNKGIIQAGQVQRMSAGTGIRHSERNPQADKPTKLLQIWVKTAKDEIAPGWEEIHVTKEQGFQPLVTPDGEGNTVKINQDFKMYSANLETGQDKEFYVHPKRHIWVQLIKGKISINGTELKEGDGASISDVENLSITSFEHSEFLLMDLK